MASRTDDDLLQPSLAESENRIRPLYSVQCGFFSSFFGGPLAGSIITAVNAYKLNRLAKDAWLIAAGVLVAAAFVWWQVRGGGDRWLHEQYGASGVRIALRLTGLAYFGVTYCVHRTYYRNMTMMGIDSPNGWPLGVASVAAGGLATFALMTLLGR